MSPDGTSALNFLTGTLAPGLAFMTTTIGNIPRRNVPWERDDEGRLALLAFAGQETIWQNIQQHGGGPGRGPWQFEPPTCGLVLNNPASKIMAHRLCGTVGIAATQGAVYDRLLDRRISPFMARLDTWCDPRALPTYGDQQATWEMYMREWRPGRPHPAFWSRFYQAALEADAEWKAARH